MSFLFIFKMIIEIKCECGKNFRGLENKEDTCPDCLKKIMEGTDIQKVIEWWK